MPAYSRWRQLGAAALAVATLVAVLGLAGARWSLGQASAITDSTARQTERTHIALLSSELQKFRLLPLVLVEYPDMAATLGDHSAAARARLDRTLEQLAQRTDAAAIYVVDATGTTLAASNWNSPASFVGQNYGFRPYFRDAMASGASEFFALGAEDDRRAERERRQQDSLPRRDRAGLARGRATVPSLPARSRARGRAQSGVAARARIAVDRSRRRWTAHPLGGDSPAASDGPRRARGRSRTPYRRTERRQCPASCRIGRTRRG